LLSGNEQHVTSAEQSSAGAGDGAAQIVPANDTLFTSGTMGRYSQTLNSVLENRQARPVDKVMAD
jgi:NADH-quinone oxidoreductase subunit G